MLEFASLSACVEQLESCRFQCEAGALENNTAWRQIREWARTDEGCVNPISAPDSTYGFLNCGDCAWCRLFGKPEMEVF